MHLDPSRKKKELLVPRFHSRIFRDNQEVAIKCMSTLLLIFTQKQQPDCQLKISYLIRNARGNHPQTLYHFVIPTERHVNHIQYVKPNGCLKFQLGICIVLVHPFTSVNWTVHGNILCYQYIMNCGGETGIYKTPNAFGLAYSVKVTGQHLHWSSEPQSELNRRIVKWPRKSVVSLWIWKASVWLMPSGPLCSQVSI